ncbi:DPOD3 polymerase, partial [Polypterus senegalus]
MKKVRLVVTGSDRNPKSWVVDLPETDECSEKEWECECEEKERHERKTERMFPSIILHCTTMSRMLYHYLEKKRKECSASQLHATYLVSGKFQQNGNTCHKVTVVREDQLEDIKSKLIVTASIHVYSIQKAALKDSSPLFSTDYDIIKENLDNCSKYSAIRCAIAAPRTSEEISRLQSLAHVATPVSDGKAVTSKPSINGDMSSTKPVSQQAKGIMGMFASKTTSKSKETSKEVKTESKADSATNTSNVRRRKKRKVLKSRTSMDEEGCIGGMVALRLGIYTGNRKIAGSNPVNANWDSALLGP